MGDFKARWARSGRAGFPMPFNPGSALCGLHLGKEKPAG